MHHFHEKNYSIGPITTVHRRTHARNRVASVFCRRPEHIVVSDRVACVKHMDREYEPQHDYPVQIDGNHRARDTADYGGRDRFDCAINEAYTHTGGWPAWSYCPFCGIEL